MRKCFCDACDREIERATILEVPCHLYSKAGTAGTLGYADSEGNRVSGRMDSIDLCNACANKAFSAALKAVNL